MLPWIILSSYLKNLQRSNAMHYWSLIFTLGCAWWHDVTHCYPIVLCFRRISIWIFPFSPNSRPHAPSPLSLHCIVSYLCICNFVFAILHSYLCICIFVFVYFNLNISILSNPRPHAPLSALCTTIKQAQREFEILFSYKSVCCKRRYCQTW